MIIAYVTKKVVGIFVRFQVRHFNYNAVVALATVFLNCREVKKNKKKFDFCLL
jgi:hypothetical protein